MKFYYISKDRTGWVAGISVPILDNPNLIEVTEEQFNEEYSKFLEEQKELKIRRKAL